MLDDLSIRHFAALQAVAAEKSFGRAAERLGFTQSAISQQIAGFERAVGKPLFDRPGGPRQIELTPIGRIMLRHAEAILAHLDAAGEEVAHLIAGVGGRLSIGTFQSITVRVLPEVIGRLKSDRPDIDIRLTESNDNQDLIDLLIDGTIDLAFLGGAITDRRISVIPLGTDPYVVIEPASDDPNPVITLDELSRTDLIGQHDDDGCQRIINQYLWSSDAKPNYIFRSDDNSAVQAMVRVGMGSAVMPYLAINADDPGIHVRELQPAIPPRQIFAAQVIDRTMPPVADELIELARGVCERLEATRIEQAAARSAVTEEAAV